jgi:hypothetical protein
MFAELISFEDVKKEPYIISHILWDKEPRDLMEPRCSASGDRSETRGPIKGYVFYIDTMDERRGAADRDPAERAAVAAFMAAEGRRVP